MFLKKYRTDIYLKSHYVEWFVKQGWFKVLNLNTMEAKILQMRRRQWTDLKRMMGTNTGEGYFQLEVES